MQDNRIKSLQKKNFIMDINILESPFFLFNQKTKALRAKDLMLDDTLDDNVREVLELVSGDTEVRYFNWRDSKGLERVMLTVSPMEIPRRFTMDVWYALVGLYIKKTAPIAYDIGEKKFEVKDDALYFTFYEVASFMKISTGGKNIKKIKDAVRELKTTQYFSFANGTIYDRGKGSYIKSKEVGISLLTDYGFESKRKEKSRKVEEKNWVKFNPLIIDNIKYEYIKYLNHNLYFSLPSGLSRGLYSYLEANKYNKNGEMHKYIKRSFAVLKNKIPVDFKYNSNLKTKLKKPLKSLIDQGFIEDYFYGDEVKINKIKEECIYFIFKGRRDEIIDMVSNKQLKLNLNLEANDEFVMKVPEDIRKTLIDLGVEKTQCEKWIKTYDSWDIIKYIIWIEKQQYEKKKINPPALLSFALKRKAPIRSGYPEIVEFVEDEKKKDKDKGRNIEELIKEKYEEYMEKEIENLKNEEPDTYRWIYNDLVLQGLKDDIDMKIKANKRQNKDISLLEEFKEKGDKSELFQSYLLKEIRLYKGLLSEEEFRMNYKDGKLELEDK